MSQGKRVSFQVASPGVDCHQPDNADGPINLDMVDVDAAAVKEMRKQICDLESALSNTRKKLAATKPMLQSQSNDILRLKLEVETLKDTCERLQDENDELNCEVDQLIEENTSTSEMLEKQCIEMEDMQTEQETLLEENKRLLEEMDVLREHERMVEDATERIRQIEATAKRRAVQLAEEKKQAEAEVAQLKEVLANARKAMKSQLVEISSLKGALKEFAKKASKCTCSASTKGVSHSGSVTALSSLGKGYRMGSLSMWSPSCGNEGSKSSTSSLADSARKIRRVSSVEAVPLPNILELSMKATNATWDTREQSEQPKSNPVENKDGQANSSFARDGEKNANSMLQAVGLNSAFETSDLLSLSNIRPFSGTNTHVTKNKVSSVSSLEKMLSRQPNKVGQDSGSVSTVSSTLSGGRAHEDPTGEIQDNISVSSTPERRSRSGMNFFRASSFRVCHGDEPICADSDVPGPTCVNAHKQLPPLTLSSTSDRNLLEGW